MHIKKVLLPFLFFLNILFIQKPNKPNKPKNPPIPFLLSVDYFIARLFSHPFFVLFKGVCDRMHFIFLINVWS